MSEVPRCPRCLSAKVSMVSEVPRCPRCLRCQGVHKVPRCPQNVSTVCEVSECNDDVF